MYISNPFLLEKINSLPELALNILFWILLAIYLVDNIVSGKVIGYVGKTTKQVGKELDNTEEITSKVKEILLGKSAVYRRLINAYPRIQSIKVKFKEKKEEVKQRVEKQKNEIKERINREKNL